LLKYVGIIFYCLAIDSECDKQTHREITKPFFDINQCRESINEMPEMFVPDGAKIIFSFCANENEKDSIPLQKFN